AVLLPQTQLADACVPNRSPAPIFSPTRPSPEHPAARPALGRVCVRLCAFQATRDPDQFPPSPPQRRGTAEWPREGHAPHPCSPTSGQTPAHSGLAPSRRTNHGAQHELRQKGKLQSTRTASKVPARMFLASWRNPAERWSIAYLYAFWASSHGLWKSPGNPKPKRTRAGDIFNGLLTKIGYSPD